MRNEMNKLQKNLKAFVESSKVTEILSTTIAEIREIYKPQEKTKSKVKNLKYFILNSIWNRVPNFRVKSVLISKLRYMFDIGTGVSSYNQLPLSWIKSPIKRIFKNFLMKDRGHITSLICYNYTTQFSIHIVLEVVQKLIKEYKNVFNWKEDDTLKIAVPILCDVRDYMNGVIKEYKSKKVKKEDMYITIEDIANNVTEFYNFLNKTPIGVEVRKESVWVHCKEILGLNNSENKWIVYQLSFLDWIKHLMQKDSDENYMRNVLNFPALQIFIDGLEGFNINDKWTLFSKSIESYSKKLTDYNEVIPVRLLALRNFKSDYKDRATHYYETNESKLTKQIMSISDNNFKFDLAEKTLELADKIIKNEKWSEYEELRIKLKNDSTIPDTYNTKCLEWSMKSEDFGLVCVDSIIELLQLYPGMKNRSTSDLIGSTIITFVDKLKLKLQEMFDDETIFEIERHTGARVEKMIHPVFEEVKLMIQSDEAVSKETLWENQLSKVKEFLNGTSKFDILIPSRYDEEYREFPFKVVSIDFSKDRKEGNLDLGQKDNKKGYVESNVFVQIMNHNRHHDGNHIVETIPYFKFFSDKNRQYVDKYEKYLQDNKMFKVLADAQTFYETFNSEEKV